MIPIYLEVIPKEKMRYDTLGDYFEDSGIIKVQVVDCGNEDYEFLIGLHEMIEMYLSKKKGIKEEDITDFDVNFEKERKNGLHSKFEEPGDSQFAPYKDCHFFATTIERLVANKLGIDWLKYEENTNKI